MKTILITGFEPFGGRKINASWEIVKRLPDEICGFKVQKLQVPVEFGTGASMILDKVRELHPAFLFMHGEAGGRTKVTPETKAVNIRKDAGKVSQKGPDEIMASIPVKEIVSSMQDYPIEASSDAGTYVCNDVFYSALYELAGSDTVVSFTHVPYIEDDVKPVLALETALETVLQYIRLTITAILSAVR